MEKVIYIEDNTISIVEKENKEKLNRWLRWSVDVRARLNPHRNIEVYGFNFEYRGYSNSILLQMFSDNETKMKNKMFVRLY